MDRSMNDSKVRGYSDRRDFRFMELDRIKYPGGRPGFLQRSLEAESLLRFAGPPPAGHAGGVPPAQRFTEESAPFLRRGKRGVRRRSQYKMIA